ncbi:ABC transporter permease [Gulosibacter chungangensis]|uniref:ABC transporter permease n=1 Tax=Gulosibacter chungangensis TaxID=979746 RepID=A0A7J5B969_9MICO|nr:ABC transporter permease [Gulosibacter chungangensis]KAB1642154.1 ABC transporter permease [Gulosibacter chungangensis]
MTRYITKRLGRTLFTLFAVVLATFGLSQVAYSDPARMIAPENATEATIESIRASLGLDQPWWVQLWRYLVHGPDIQGVPSGMLTNWPPSLGYSYHSQRPVSELILEKLPVTIDLAVGAFVIWMVLSVLLGVTAARKPGGWFDRVTSGISYVLLSIPTFLLGVLFLYFFYFQLSMNGFRIFPGGGYVPFNESPSEWFRHLILPWLTIALVEIGVFQRVVRSSVLEVAGNDYIRTARAKGLGPNRVYFGHALSAAANPIMTLGAIEFAAILGGAIVTEQIFGLDGIGRLAVTSAQGGDAPVVIAVALVGAVAFVLFTTIVDIITHARSGK